LKNSTSILVGHTETLFAIVEPDNATNKNVTWSSTNTAIASVATDGVVTAVSAGEALIYVATKDGGHQAMCTVTVSPKEIPLTGVSLNKASTILVVGESEELIAEITPSNATNQNITWSSSNTTVAEVSEAGVVTAKNAGTANITVTTDDGNKTASCNVTVNKTPGAAVSAPTGASLVTSNSITINAVAAPGNGQTVEYAINTTNTAPSSGWQDSTTFTGLNWNTTYYIFARSKENTNYNAGTPSASLRVINAEWARTVSTGNDVSSFKSVAVDSSGNIYAAGSQSGTGVYTYGTGVTARGYSTYPNVVLVKYNSGGTAQWAKTVSTGNDDSFFSSVAVDSSGNIYTAGYQKGTGVYTYGTGVTARGSSTNGNVVLVKYNSGGTAQWAKTVSTGDDQSLFTSVAVDASGNIYTAGYQKGTGVYTYGTGVTAQGSAYNNNVDSSSGSNVVLVKYDSSGTAQWARTVSTGNDPSRFSSVAVDSSGNIYAAGSQRGTGVYTYGTGVTARGYSTYANVVLVKYNSGGTAQWAKTVVSTGNDVSSFSSVAVDSSGNIYAAGSQGGTGVYTYGTGVTAQGSSTNINNVVLVKYNSSGTAQWAKTVVSTGNDLSGFCSVAVDSSGNIYAAGYQGGTGVFTYGPGVTAQGSSQTTLLSGNALLVIYNSNGTAQWAKTVSTGNNASPFSSVAVDGSGNIYTAGSQVGSDIYTYGPGVTAQGSNSNSSGTSALAGLGNAVLVKYR
jgi:altronate dehydratase